LLVQMIASARSNVGKTLSANLQSGEGAEVPRQWARQSKARDVDKDNTHVVITAANACPLPARLAGVYPSPV
jgi:hypothetical protein